MKLISFLIITGIVITNNIAHASPINGTKYFRDTIGKEIAENFDVILRGKEVTVIMVRGNGKSDIDCFLYDEKDNLVSKDTDTTDICNLSITPEWTGHFTIRVTNVGDSTTTFVGIVE